MDPGITDLTASVMAIITSYASIGAKEMIKSAGKDIYEKAKSLYAVLKKRLAGDEAAEHALAGFEKDPELFKSPLEEILKKKLNQDIDLFNELSEFINVMGPILNVVQTIEKADGVVGVETEEINRGKLSVNQKAAEAKNMVGVTVKRIG
ncbi:MAG: hypothetical protein K8R67_03845 [Desulfobacteraceae bacterium]|nr:hypothetical protein [Desulfobacteraceae bacterium]